MEIELAVKFSAIFQLCRTDPTVLPVPPPDRQSAEYRNRQHGPEAGLQKQSAALRNKQEKGEERDQLKSVEIFRQEAAADGEAGQKPVDKAIRFERAGKEIRRPEPEEGGERINRHDHRADGIERHDAGDQHGHQRGGFIVPATGEEKNLPGRPGGKHDRKKADTQNVVAAEGRAGGDGVGDGRALAEVAGIEMARPLEVIGLVRNNRQPGAEEEAEGGGHRDDGNRGRRGRQAKEAGRWGGSGAHEETATIAAG